MTPQELVRLRNRLGYSQSQFAERFGFNVRTLQQWEQGRLKPTGTALTLLRLIERDPQLVQEAAAKPPSLTAALRALKHLRPTLRTYGIRHAYIFGSLARGENAHASDVDVLIDVDPKAAFSSLLRAELLSMFQNAFNRPVDLLTMQNSFVHKNPHVLQVAVRAF